MRNQSPKYEFRTGSIFRGLCPACHIGRATKGLFEMHEKCPHSSYNLQPEPGFYLGAMFVGFLLTAMVTIPPTIILKILNVDINLLIAFPFIEFAFVGPFLLFYCRVLWLHLEYRVTDRLDGHAKNPH